MKLRLRGNSLRLRVNRGEVRTLSVGERLEEKIQFPGGGELRYVLTPAERGDPRAEYDGRSIQISVPGLELAEWASSQELGIYFELAAGAGELKVSIEKDLECLHGPEDERDPEAFPRT